jgi:hypothetical protein
MTSNEAKEFVAIQSVPPDDLNINNKIWSIESTQLTKREAQADAEFFMPSEVKIFKYQNGFVLYRKRNY